MFARVAQPHLDRASVGADIREVRTGVPNPSEEAQGIDRLENEDANLAPARAGGQQGETDHQEQPSKSGEHRPP
jgi:hypothetical protein